MLTAKAVDDAVTAASSQPRSEKSCFAARP